VSAWSFLLVSLMITSRTGSTHPAQANPRTTSITLTSTVSPAAAPAVSPAATYIVQPGDTLSGIAARFAIRGGWPPLYRANRPRLGPNPNTIYPGTVLVLPRRAALARYTVASGDTLSGIAARFAIRGGWPPLYRANRPRLGSNPNTIHPGTVLTLPAALSAPSLRPHHSNPTTAPSHQVPSAHAPRPARTGAPAAATGLPQWLKLLLLAVGLLVVAVFLIEPAILLTRRGRRQSKAQPLPPGQSQPAPAAKTHIIMADHDRLVVTRDRRDGTVYVLRPPREDPRAIMQVARLVLPEDPYRELARELGMPASWPIVLADHDRLVVTRDLRDDTVYVLRPPGEDPRAIMQVARLVLPEDPYRELAEQLGVPTTWPLE
jgi:LysM repeat protein